MGGKEARVNNKHGYTACSVRAGISLAPSVSEVSAERGSLELGCSTIEILRLLRVPINHLGLVFYSDCKRFRAGSGW